MTRKQTSYCLKILKLAYRILTLCLIMNILIVQGQFPHNLFFIIFDIYIIVSMFMADETFYFWFHKDEIQTMGKYRRFERLVINISFLYALLMNLLYWNYIVYGWQHSNGK